VLFLALALALPACSSDDDAADEPGASTTTDPAAALINEDGVDARPPLPADVTLPIVFVHGFAGSAQQFESQAMRFVANGYPQERIVVYEHDGAGVDFAGYTTGLGKIIDATLKQFGSDKVFLAGHSRGTIVSNRYLSNPDRAAKVAKYVAIDGAPCSDAVPCIAPTQENKPGQAHVEVATSKESFAMIYEFLLGSAPEVVDVVPQRAPVVLSGRAVNFPANTGRADTSLDIWRIDPATGNRTGDAPYASFELGPEGEFGPFETEVGARFEWVLSAPTTEVQHHLYLQPYLRSSHLVRLLSSGPDGDTRRNTNVSDTHAAIVAIRMREWYATDDPDLPADDRDVLEISTRGASGETKAVNAIPRFVENNAIGLHIHDDAKTPGRTTRKPLPYFSGAPFQNGVDVFIPGADPPNATITVTNIPRGDQSKPQTLNVPNWASAGHAISVVFTDFPVD
jgi:pimeloyl-ACP methyl ester carboxylesterase